MPVVSGIELSDADLAGFREVFDLVDKDKSGAIEMEEAGRDCEVAVSRTSASLNTAGASRRQSGRPSDRSRTSTPSESRNIERR